MINIILNFGKEYIDSEDYAKSFGNITSYHDLSEDDEGTLLGLINSVITGQTSENNFRERCISSTDLSREKVEKIYTEIKKEIFDPFKIKISEIVGKHIDEIPSSLETPPLEIKRGAGGVPESITKSSILEGIENPPRTVIKRYVLEHEPITDPEHLIDDSVDERLKLQ